MRSMGDLGKAIRCVPILAVARKEACATLPALDTTEEIRAGDVVIEMGEGGGLGDAKF